MLAEAREAQWTPATFMGSDAIKLVAPAKVNLFLGVGAREADGYHAATSVMHALSLHDNIYMKHSVGNLEGPSAYPSSDDRAMHDGASSKRAPADPPGKCAPTGPDGRCLVSIEIADKTGMSPAHSHALKNLDPAQNLAWQAVNRLAIALNRSVDEQIHIRIEKNIPAESGLGGGSADAAAALLGAACFWQATEDSLDDRLLRKVATDIGVDVSFFLDGGCALMKGRGDVFERRLTPSKAPLVVIRPEAGVSTAEAYRAFDGESVPVDEALLAAADAASSADEVPLYNNLEGAAFSIEPELAEAKAWLESKSEYLDGAWCKSGREMEGAMGCEAQPAQPVLMSGSGSAIFAVCKTYADAVSLSALAKSNGWWARATTFSALKAAKV